MEQHKDDIKRNIPSDEGRRNDPHIRDESAQQPGVNTLSSSDFDDENQRTTKTASDSFRTENWGADADATFDDVVDDDDND
jgi:hypothetical protein